MESKMNQNIQAIETFLEKIYNEGERKFIFLNVLRSGESEVSFIHIGVGTDRVDYTKPFLQLPHSEKTIKEVEQAIRHFTFTFDVKQLNSDDVIYGLDTCYTIDRVKAFEITKEDFINSGISILAEKDLNFSLEKEGRFFIMRDKDDEVYNKLIIFQPNEIVSIILNWFKFQATGFEIDLETDELKSFPIGFGLDATGSYDHDSGILTTSSSVMKLKESLGFEKMFNDAIEQMFGE